MNRLKQKEEKSASPPAEATDHNGLYPNQVEMLGGEIERWAHKSLPDYSNSYTDSRLQVGDIFVGPGSMCSNVLTMCFYVAEM